MNGIIVEAEIENIVDTVISDFDGDKTIDAVNIFNKPDKAEVTILIALQLQLKIFFIT